MYKYSKISRYKIKKILKLFSQDLPATKTAKILGLNRKTVDRYYGIFRQQILNYSKKENEQLAGEIEVDESYFGPQRVRGKRGRGAKGKIPVFGILKREGKVHVSIVNDCSRDALMPIIKGQILEGSTIYTDGWRAYDGLILNGYEHYRIFHSHNEFARGKNHVNGIESFWSFTKRRLAKFNGIPDAKFILHLKESEFRFNFRNDSLFDILLDVVFSKL
ncbi:IS1595 family transposase [bacterium]|nr:MAG: IS1595 family transposase [bacterium]QQR61732.1 MAG: IS1595 family transposase [bacterium]QQR62700.1 MAG: IS1595 family transposase [bacterium]